MKTVLTERKTTGKYNISTDIVSLTRQETLSRHSHLAGVTEKGLTVHSDKKFFLVPEKELSTFLNHPVELFLSQYEIPFYGIISKICSIRENLFEISVDFTENTPLYYRECVADLLN